MQRLNRDTIVAIILLALCGVFFYVSFDIRTPEFERLAPGQMDPGLWPRIILSGLVLMALIYLAQSVISPPADQEERGGLNGWYRHYRNPIHCFLAFGAFMLLIPYLGMLLAGMLFVFGMMTMLGGRERWLIGTHATVSVCTVGGMWFIFACLLSVQLPRSSLFPDAEEWLLVNICGISEAIGGLFAAAPRACAVILV